VAIFPSSGIDRTATENAAGANQAELFFGLLRLSARRGAERVEPDESSDVDHTAEFNAAFLSEKGVAVKQHVRGIASRG